MLPDDADRTTLNANELHSSSPPTRSAQRSDLPLKGGGQRISLTSPLEGEVAGTEDGSGGWGVSDTETPSASLPNPALAPAHVTTLPLVGTPAAHDDAVAVEAPLEVRLGGK